MAMVGYEEELRMLAQPTLLPGAESGGFGQDDVASPVFAAWSKQEKAGELLEMSLASLSMIAMRAMKITERAVPARLAQLADDTQLAFADGGDREALGPKCAGLAATLRRRTYS
jgi:histidine ammonia-lyase